MAEEEFPPSEDEHSDGEIPMRWDKSTSDLLLGSSEGEELGTTPGPSVYILGVGP